MPVPKAAQKATAPRQRPRGTKPVRQPTIAYLSYSTGEFDARSFRMAESAIDAGYRVRIYSRWQPGQPQREDRGDYELVRVPYDWRLAVPLLRGRARRRLAGVLAAATPPSAPPVASPGAVAGPPR